MRVSGQSATDTFAHEAGGHRWQREPPTERRGRVHTSTVTVAVFPEPEPAQLNLREADLRWITRRGSGPGGQARNKLETAVELTHVPTGLVVRCQSERSQLQNKRSALAVLRARLHARTMTAAADAENAARRAQVGSGMRGDKRRTIRVQDGQVHDHVTGRRWRLADYLRGAW